MNWVEIYLEQLICAVIDSDEYQRYQAVRDKIRLEPEKARAINDFRKRNFQLQHNRDNGNLFEDIDRLEQEFLQFRTEPLVEEYLSAELAVCRLVQKINWRLMERIEIDLEFFD